MSELYQCPDQFSVVLLAPLPAGSVNTDVVLSGVGGLPTTGNAVLTVLDGTGKALERITGWTAITGTTLVSAQRLLGNCCPANSRVEILWDSAHIERLRTKLVEIMASISDEARIRELADTAILDQKGEAFGIAPLGDDKKIPPQFLSAIVANDTYYAANQEEMLALHTVCGDMVRRSDENITYFATTNADPKTMDDYAIWGDPITIQLYLEIAARQLADENVLDSAKDYADGVAADAVATSSADATAKANAAKDYADGLNSAMDTRMDRVELISLPWIVIAASGGDYTTLTAALDAHAEAGARFLLKGEVIEPSYVDRPSGRFLILPAGQYLYATEGAKIDLGAYTTFRIFGMIASEGLLTLRPNHPFNNYACIQVIDGSTAQAHLYILADRSISFANADVFIMGASGTGANIGVVDIYLSANVTTSATPGIFSGFMSEMKAGSFERLAMDITLGSGSSVFTNGQGFRHANVDCIGVNGEALVVRALGPTSKLGTCRPYALGNSCGVRLNCTYLTGLTAGTDGSGNSVFSTAFAAGKG